MRRLVAPSPLGRSSYLRELISPLTLTLKIVLRSLLSIILYGRTDTSIGPASQHPTDPGHSSPPTLAFDPLVSTIQ